MNPNVEVHQQHGEDEHTQRADAERIRLEGQGQHLAEMRTLAAVNARAALHAQAVAVQSIKTLIPVVLDIDSANYSKWSNLLLNTLGKYSLDDHVLSDDGDPDAEAWAQLDCTVKSWLYGTISSDLLELVMTRKATSRSIWLGLEQQFLGNKETRALYLDANFRNFVQGNLSITEYCRKLKGMADALDDLGETVPDRTLILNVLRGLNDKFSYMTALLKRQKPFPSFIEVRSDLLLEELTMANKPSSAFLVGSSGGSTNHATTTIGGSGNNSGSYSGSRSKNHRRGRHNKSPSGTNPPGGGTSLPGGLSGKPSWPTVFNPWTGTFQVWSGPSAPSPADGLLGPRPHPQTHRPTQHQALVASTYSNVQPHDMPPSVPAGMQPHVPGAPTGYSTMQHHAAGGHNAMQPSIPAWPMMQAPPGVPGAPFLGWDQAALANSFNTMTLKTPANTDWYLDSGATSHMTSDAGSSLQERDRQVQ